MQLIKPKFEILEQLTDLSGLATMDYVGWDHDILLKGIYEHIELAGRTCYQSQHLIHENSAEKFVNRMIESGHGAMLEHGTVYLKISDSISDPYHPSKFIRTAGKYLKNAYSKVQVKVENPLSNQEITSSYITTNLRVLVENDWLDDLQYICEPTEYHEKRITIRFTSDIHFYKDLTRHRVFSWAIESTRWCNYMKEKFGVSVNFSIPCWLKDEEKEEFENDLKTIENIYFKWLNKGWKTDQAAYFLIQGTNAEVIMTGNISDFNHFFELRDCSHAHVTIQELIHPLHEEFKKRNYIK